MAYRLLAMDMDGTVLNSEKIVTPRTEQAIRTAIRAGYEVLFASGRGPSEMRRYLAQFPEMRYAIGLSGAAVFDLQRGESLVSVTIPRPLAEEIITTSEEVDAMVVVFAGPEVYVERKRREQLGYFGCDCFAKLYDDCAVWVEDVADVLKRDGDRIYKINLYCHTEADWKLAGEKLGHLPVSYAQGIPNNYEISPQGVDKGAGLELLCRTLGIPVEESIAVGDEGNDLAMLRAAGLGVAMANASPAVKAAADVLTADCDHDGVADVIEKYLLTGETT